MNLVTGARALARGAISYEILPLRGIKNNPHNAREKNEFNIYYIRGIVAGLSPVTFAWWILVGTAAADIPRGAAGEVISYLPVIAMLVGLATGSFGWLMGFGYGVLKRQSHDPKLRRHPKNLWW
jgi:hypothetical protein